MAGHVSRDTVLSDDFRGIPTHRGWVKKIRFAPGKGNQKLLVMYTDGAEVWDTKEVSNLLGTTSVTLLGRCSASVASRFYRFAWGVIARAQRYGSVVFFSPCFISPIYLLPA